MAASAPPPAPPPPPPRAPVALTPLQRAEVAYRDAVRSSAVVERHASALDAASSRYLRTEAWPPLFWCPGRAGRESESWRQSLAAQLTRVGEEARTRRARAAERIADAAKALALAGGGGGEPQSDAAAQPEKAEAVPSSLTAAPAAPASPTTEAPSQAAHVASPEAAAQAEAITALPSPECAPAVLPALSAVEETEIEPDGELPLDFD